MTEYEKTWLEYGEARGLWKAARAQIRLMLGDDRADLITWTTYKTYRDSSLVFFHVGTIQNIIHRAWSARNKAARARQCREPGERTID